MKLKVFTTARCPECKVVKSYLLAMNIDFEDVLVDNPETIAYLEKKTGQRRVPVIESSQGFIVGFKPEAIKKLLSPNLQCD